MTLNSQMSMFRKHPHIDPRLFNTEEGQGDSGDIDMGKEEDLELRRLVVKFGLKPKTIPTAEQFVLIMLPFVDDGPQKLCETFDAYRLRVNRATVNMGIEHRFVPKYLPKHEFPTESAYDKARGNHQSRLKCRQKAHRNMLDPKHSTFNTAYVEKRTTARKERHIANAARRHNALDMARKAGEELCTPDPPECSDDELWDWNSRGPIATDPNSRKVRDDRKHEIISPHGRFCMPTQDSELEISGDHDTGPVLTPTTSDTPVIQTPDSENTTTRPAARRSSEKNSRSKTNTGTQGQRSTTTGHQPRTAPRRRRPDISKNPSSCNNCERNARPCDGKRPCDSCKLWREVELCDASNENPNMSMRSHSQQLLGYNPGYIQLPTPPPSSFLVNPYVAETSLPTYDAVQEPEPDNSCVAEGSRPTYDAAQESDWTSTGTYSPTWMSTGPLILLPPKPVFPAIKEVRVPSDVRHVDSTKCCNEMACKVNLNTFFMDQLSEREAETEDRYCSSVLAKACDHLGHGNHYTCQEFHDQQTQNYEEEEDGYPHGVVSSTKAFLCDDCTYAAKQKYRSRQGVNAPFIIG